MSKGYPRLCMVRNHDALWHVDIANGTVRAACKDRHRHQEVLSFPRTIDESVPKELDVHLILDNYATHQYEKIK